MEAGCLVVFDAGWCGGGHSHDGGIGDECVYASARGRLRVFGRSGGCVNLKMGYWAEIWLEIMIDWHACGVGTNCSSAFDIKLALDGQDLRDMTHLDFTAFIIIRLLIHLYTFCISVNLMLYAYPMYLHAFVVRMVGVPRGRALPTTSPHATFLQNLVVSSRASLQHRQPAAQLFSTSHLPLCIYSPSHDGPRRRSLRRAARQV